MNQATQSVKKRSGLKDVWAITILTMEVLARHFCDFNSLLPHTSY